MMKHIVVGFALGFLRAAEAETSTCTGFDEEWSRCPAGVPCPDGGDCTPVDCEFGIWGDWIEAGLCTQIKFRQRSILKPNNKCGEPCQGSTIESAASANPACGGFATEDCMMDDWSDWTTCGAGLSLSFRDRSVTQNPSNGGVPCSSTTRHARPCKEAGGTACELSQWVDWSPCTATCGIGTWERTRSVVNEANLGPACDGALREIANCRVGECPSSDCVLSVWSTWSACDVSASQRYRTRQVEQTAIGSGTGCLGRLSETEPCAPAPANVCVLGDWSSWGICDRECGGGQQHRVRVITSSVDASVRFCRWEGPDGVANLRETQECNVRTCGAGQLDCRLSDWLDWSSCSASCGQGIIQRYRRVLVDASEGGQGCVGALREVNDCSGEACEFADCAWGDWFDWSACTATCGTGYMRRSRVVMQAPLRGKLCAPEDKSEMSECVMEPCDNKCKDAEWGPWTPWSPCSATCSDGFEARERQLASQPNECGAPLQGNTKEFRQCSSQSPCVPDSDCSLSAWSEWSDCSCSCFGVRERSRNVAAFASGRGKLCNLESLRQVEACNPSNATDMPVGCGRGPQIDCALSEWSDWSMCSRSCGGGQKSKTRFISTFPKGIDSEKCNDAIELIAGCNENECSPVECIDCALSEWSDWGPCTHCGGQRYRSKSIMILPTACGKQCPSVVVKEASMCVSECSIKLACSWSPWSEGPSCESGVGSTTTRSRTLGFPTLGTGSASIGNLASINAGDDAAIRRMDENNQRSQKAKLFESFETGLCIGSQIHAATCYDVSCPEGCTPEDCIFLEWSDWGEASCLGVCSRTRGVAREGNSCGERCNGTLKETKSCDPVCKANVDCELSDWRDWNACTTPFGQKLRSREIVVFPHGQGNVCEKALEQTSPCDVDSRRDACVLAPWGAWGQCSLSCGGGYQTRARLVAEHASPLGKPCDDSIEQLQPCNMHLCGPAPNVDCVYSDWSPWSACQSGQRYRDRSIATFATAGGKGCDDALRVVAVCMADVRDCILSDWTDWNVCDRSCGPGQTARHRGVEHFQSLGGKDCEGALQGTVLFESRGCQVDECRVIDGNCGVSDWEDWGPCTATCSFGQKIRVRSIRNIRSDNGDGCSDAVAETSSCSDLPPCEREKIDCLWADWESWSECTCTCGGGQRNRARHIAVFPMLGGMPCNPIDMEELAECNTQECSPVDAVDGEWAAWEEWTECSATCQSGARFRHRQVAVMANEFGKPPVGDIQEVELCNVDVQCVEPLDCQFGTWSEWSACSDECDGVSSRFREVDVYGRGSGRHCSGPLIETHPCNPGLGELTPPQCRVAGNTIDCQLDLWTEWSMCTASCGGGHTVRSRVISVYASGGGSPCETDLSEVNECARVSCPTSEITDCELGDWQDWGSCTRCDGERLRLRTVAKEAMPGGRQCSAASLTDVEPCPHACSSPGLCTWLDWGAWSSCDNMCGPNARRMRRRALHHVSTSSSMLEDKLGAKELVEEYIRHSVRLQALEKQSSGELFVSFGVGCGVFLTALVAFRITANSRLGGYSRVALEGFLE